MTRSDVLHWIVGLGISPDVLSRSLGHASIATTGNIYTHDSDEAAAEAAEIVGRAIRGEVKQ